MSDILDVADRNNKKRNIVGMMLYADGNILQVQEDEEQDVQATFLAIQLDRRHRGIFVILETNIETRQFASWTMGFRQLTKAELKRFPIYAKCLMQVMPKLLSDVTQATHSPF